MTNNKVYRIEFSLINTLSPGYLFGHAGLYILGGVYD